MPAIINQSIIVTDDAGHKIVLSKTDKPSTETVVTLTCDSRRCSSRHEAKEPITIVWNEEEAKVDVRSLPAEFFGLIKLVPDPLNDASAVFFCSVQCAKDYLTYDYIPPRTKKEYEESLKVTAAAKNAIAAQDLQMKLPFEESNESTNSQA